MRAVNLLPRPEAKSRKLRPNGAVLAATCAPVLACGLIAAAYSLSSGSVSEKEQTLAGLEAELAVLPAPTPVDPTNVALSREADERIVAVGAALADRVAVDRVLREISLVLPEDVWLSGLTIRSATATGEDASASAGDSATPEEPSSEGGAPAAEGERGGEGSTAPPAVPEGSTTAESAGFALVGYTYSQEGVARMLSRLAVIPHLGNVRLTESLSVPAGKRSVVQFTIIADLRTAKESS